MHFAVILKVSERMEEEEEKEEEASEGETERASERWPGDGRTDAICLAENNASRGKRRFCSKLEEGREMLELYLYGKTSAHMLRGRVMRRIFLSFNHTIS